MSGEALQQRLYQTVLSEAKKLVQESGLTEPPFSPARLIRNRPIKIVTGNLGAVGALLIPGKDNFTIKINRLDPPERQSFSCAHEIAHTFFYQGEAKLLLEELCAIVGPERCNRFEEMLCDVGASELLMPFLTFQKYASQYGYSIEGLVPLSNKFQTSIQATAIRIGQVCPEACDVILGKWDAKKERLEIRTLAPFKARSPKGEAHFLSLKTIKNAKHPLLEAFRSVGSEPLYFDEMVSLGRFQRRRRIECQAFGFGERRFVVALVFPISA